MLAYALRDDSAFAEALDGVAFLSTPFIQARERLVAGQVLKMVPGVVAVLAFMIVMSLWLIPRTTLGSLGEVTKPETLIVLPILIGVGLLSFIVTHRRIGRLKEVCPSR